MSRFSDELNTHVRKIGVTAAALIRAFHEEEDWNLDEDAALPDDEVSAHVKGLLAGERTSVYYFFRDKERVTKLAAALKLSVEALRAMRATRVLVLHPLLPNDIREFLLRQQDAGRYECVELSAEGIDMARVMVERSGSVMKVLGLTSSETQSVREVLRKAASSEPGCLVVTPMDDRGYYLAADIDTTEVKSHPRGFVLTQAPDLVPMPAPLPPEFFDEDGTPMIPHDRFEEVVRKEIKDYDDPPWGRGGVYRGSLFRSESELLQVRARLAALDETRRKTSFRVDELLPWWSENQELDIRPISDLTFEDVIQEQLSSTYWWVKDRQLHAVGPECHRIDGLLGPHHEIEQSDAVIELRNGLAECNPFRPQQAAEACIERFLQRTSHRLEIDVDTWKNRVDLEAGDESQTRPWDSLTQAAMQRWTVHPGDQASIDQARARIRALLQREFVLESLSLTFPLVLNAVANAPLLVLSPKGHDYLHVVADLGSRGYVRLRVMRFRNESSSPVLSMEGKVDEFDGGDVHMWIEASAPGVLTWGKD